MSDGSGATLSPDGDLTKRLQCQNVETVASPVTQVLIVSLRDEVAKCEHVMLMLFAAMSNKSMYSSIGVFQSNHEHVTTQLKQKKYTYVFRMLMTYVLLLLPIRARLHQ